MHLSTYTFLQMPQELLSILRLVRRDINIFPESIRTELIRAYQEAVPEQVESIIQDGIDNGELGAVDARVVVWN